MIKAYPDLTDTMVLQKLLCHGLFPNSIDKIFSSSDYGNLILTNSSNPNLNISNNTFNFLPYKITQYNNGPRHLSIPHPLAFTALSKDISNNWDRIDNSIIQANNNYRKISMIIPKDHNKNKRLISFESYDKSDHQLEQLLLKQYKANYIVYADISKCYPSIYTHSIPWALVGRFTAKQNRNGSIWYNKIDKSSMRLKDYETNGIPIGPDTSNILSEIILSQVDRELNNKYKYIRFIDDYKCFCETEENAKEFITDLSMELEKYQLELNLKKTSIKKLPQPMIENWVRELKYFKFKNNNNITYSEVVDFLDLSIDLSIKKGDDSPIKYAIKSLRSKNYNSDNDYIMSLKYIFNVVYLHPYVIGFLDIIIRKGYRSYNNSKEIDKLLRNFLSDMLVKFISIGHSDIIVWSIFYALKFDINISYYNRKYKPILRLNDPLPTLMLYLYARKNGHSLTIYYDKLRDIEQDVWWLYVYELFRIDENSVRQRLQNIQYETFYAWIKQNSISFLTDAINI